MITGEKRINNVFCIVWERHTFTLSVFFTMFFRCVLVKVSVYKGHKLQTQTLLRMKYANYNNAKQTVLKMARVYLHVTSGYFMKPFWVIMFAKHYTSVRHMILSLGQSDETASMQMGAPVFSSHFREESTNTTDRPNVYFPVQIASLVTAKAPLTRKPISPVCMSLHKTEHLLPLSVLLSSIISGVRNNRITWNIKCCEWRIT